MMDAMDKLPPALLVFLGAGLGGRLGGSFARLGALGLAGALGVELFGGRRGDDVDHQQFGIGDQRDTGGQLDLAGGDLGSVRLTSLGARMSALLGTPLGGLVGYLQWRLGF